MAEKAEIEARAKEMGWVPKDEFRGDPEKWTEAGDWVERGETLIPIMKANTRRLEEQVQGLRSDLQRANKAIEASAETIEALKEFNSAENRRRMKEQLAATKTQLIEAKRENNPEAEVELTERLGKEQVALREAEAANGGEKKAEKKDGKEEDFTANPEWKAWAGDNAWFGKDRRRTAMALAIADEIHSNPETASLRGKAFLNKVTEQVDEFFNSKEGTRQSKVEGGGRGSETSDEGGKGRSFSDLPADAKAACERQASRLVGEGRAFKTADEWRKHYVKEFYSE